MATIRRFEDLQIWQLARKLCNDVYLFMRYENFSKDFKLVNQINGSSGSVMDNIAEGFDRGNRKEFINFLGIAKGSCGEVKSQLQRAFDRKYISEEEFKNSYSLTDEINRKVHGLITYLNNSEIKGQRYKGSAAESDSSYESIAFNLSNDFLQP